MDVTSILALNMCGSLHLTIPYLFMNEQRDFKSKS